MILKLKKLSFLNSSLNRIFLRFIPGYNFFISSQIIVCTILEIIKHAFDQLKQTVMKECIPEDKKKVQIVFVVQEYL